MDKRDELPHYMMPNFASILPDYANVEVDQIRNAFSTGNYQGLARLPNNLKPNEVAKARQNQMQDSLHQVAKPKMVTSCGLFSQFEYVPSRYNLEDDLNKTERIESQAKRLQIGGKEFVAGMAGRKLKHEGSYDNDKHAFMYTAEPYAHYRDAELRARWIADKKILHGPFVSAGNSSVLDAPTRLLLPKLMQDIHKAIMADWEDYAFTVECTDDENVAIKFEMDSVDCEAGLVAYMNVFSRNNPVMSTYGLQKLTIDWNVKPGDGYLYFVLRPPWAKIPTAYLAVPTVLKK